MFQSSPNLAAGCHNELQAVSNVIELFQSSPNLAAGCHFCRYTCDTWPFAVSILTQPCGWVPPSGSPASSSDLRVSILTQPCGWVPPGTAHTITLAPPTFY